VPEHAIVLNAYLGDLHKHLFQLASNGDKLRSLPEQYRRFSAEILADFQIGKTMSAILTTPSLFETWKDCAWHPLHKILENGTSS
jgi:hypothetical protein